MACTPLFLRIRPSAPFAFQSASFATSAGSLTVTRRRVMQASTSSMFCCPPSKSMICEACEPSAGADVAAKPHSERAFQALEHRCGHHPDRLFPRHPESAHRRSRRHLDRPQGRPRLDGQRPAVGRLAFAGRCGLAWVSWASCRRRRSGIAE